MALSGAVFAGFSPVLDNEFLVVDDLQYITANPHVLGGLSGADVSWAFTTFHAGNWHPLTWISLQGDVTLFGAGPRGVHFMNLVIHAASAVGLFLALRLMTGAVGRSAFVAAFFAVHPLRVESVAWAAERKDVLSGLFCMLTLLGYGWYVRRRSLRRYLLVLLAFVLGLLAKPMLVTLPCVLLLLDWWPLGRLAGSPVRHREQDGGASAPLGSPKRERGKRKVASGSRGDIDTGILATKPVSPLRFGALLWEKVPLFALAAALCAVTVVAQEVATLALAKSSVMNRIEIALVAYVMYLGKMFWPVELAPMYPYPLTGIPSWQVGGAVVLLLGITLLAWRVRSSEPALLMGWLWYLGTLVPVIGLIQVGSQMMADRYTYLPAIGVGIAVVWPVADLAARRGRETALAGVAAVVLVIALVVTWGQVHFWQNDILLWERTLEVTGPGNLFAQEALGLGLSKREQFDEAAKHIALGLRMAPEDPDLNAEFGSLLLRFGNPHRALEHLTQAASKKPRSATIQLDLGTALYHLGRVAEAVEQFQAAIDADPRLDSAFYRLGQSLCRQGKWEEAIAQFHHAVDLQRQMSRYHCALAYALSRSGKTAAADAEYREASQIDPDWMVQCRALAWKLSTDPRPGVRNGIEGLDLAERLSNSSGGNDPEDLETLAAAYAAVERYEDAVATARKALAAVTHSGSKPDLAEALRKHLAVYEQREALKVAPDPTAGGGGAPGSQAP
jgi:tetratricopeptide (TPR) repeat protein